MISVLNCRSVVLAPEILAGSKRQEKHLKERELFVIKKTKEAPHSSLERSEP